MSLIERWWKIRKSVSENETAGESTNAVPAAEADEESTNEAPAAETAEEMTEETVAAAEEASGAVPAEEAAEEAEETVETTPAAGEAVEEVTVEAVEAVETTPAAEETVEEAAEETLETAPTEESAEPVAEPAEEPAEEPAAEPAEEPEAELVAEPAEEPAEEPAAVFSEEPVSMPAEESEAIAEAPAASEAPEEVTAQSTLESLEPADVFRYFREISAIPHGSFNTKAISDYLEEFAKAYELDYVRDEKGNLIIRKDASAGCADADPIAMQGHIDMVCEKESSNPIDMDTEAITLNTDGEWLWADRTTLGGDDGIAVAIMLALLSDDTIPHPPLECIFTVDEEAGMLGAFSMDLSSIKSRKMLNLDSENEGIITAACAGGAEEICSLPGKQREKKGEVLTISIEGLRGGHSGECIGMGRANASLLLARLLYRLEKDGKFCLVQFHGGTRDNAIPREANAEILFTGLFQRSAVKNTVAAFAKEIEKEYSETDPDIRIRAIWANKGKKVSKVAFTRKDSRRMIRFLLALPNGVLEFTPMFRDVPQTSLSLGIVNTVADGIRTHSLVRSSINSQKQMVMDKIECIAEEFGASVETEGTYPAWELIPKSDFRDLAAEVYKETTGKEALVCVTHGGLECGLITSKVPGIDCISVGPDMEEVHTPAERLNIPSSRRTYEYIKKLLEACTK